MRIYGFLAKKVGDLTIKYSNFPESYVKRSYEQVYWKNPTGYKQYPQAEIKRKKFRFTTHRPWTAQFRLQNERGTHRKKVFLEPVGEWSFFKGDRVEIQVGRDKGKQGIINQVIQERNWVFVEGMNTHMRTVGKDKNFPGITVRSEAPLLVTTGVKLVDPETLKPTEVEWRYTEEGEKVRVSLTSSRIIPIPKAAEETMDFKSKELYMENVEKDTDAADVAKNTYKAAAVMKKETDFTSYVPYISDAGKSNVDIIVIPSPELAKTDKYDETVKTLSNAAKSNRLYVVAPLLKSMKCQKVDVVVRNNLVFDRDGAVISTYSKPVHDVPNCTTSNPGLHTFTTDFGVTFGLLMEEDLVLQNLEMMKGLNNFVVVGQFASEMPILRAPKFAPSWAFTTYGNLVLSAGIYSGKAGSVGVCSNNMVAAELNMDGRSDEQVRPPIVSSSKIQNIPGEDLSQYTVRPLNLEDSNRGYKGTVCHGSFCCDFDVKTVGSTQNNLSYGLAVFNGVRQLGGSNNIGVQTCSVVTCSGLYKQSCSIGSTNEKNDVHFEKLSVTANFTGFSSAQFPVIVTADPSNFKFDSQTVNDDKRVSVQIGNTKNVSNFGIFGRVYGLDSDSEDTFGYKNVNNTEAVNLDIYEYIFNEDVIELFDYLWIRLRILFVVVSIYFLEMM